MHVAGRLVALAGVVALLIAAPAAGALHGGSPGQTGIDADTVVLEAALAPDGDATWRVAYRIRLDDRNATDAFESLRADIEANRSGYLDRFGSRLRRTVGAAENATGRRMSVRNLSVEVRRESQPDVSFGVVTYRYEWVRFGTVEGRTVRAGDAVDQFILDSATVLRFTWPANYSRRSSTPAPTTTGTDAVVWRGPRDFDAGEPRLVVVPDSTVDGSAGTDSRGSGDGSNGRGLPVVIVGLVVLAALAAGGGWLFARRRDAGNAPEDVASDAGGADGAPEQPPEELLTNEERVLRLLEGNGGRMKQQAVAEELDWTAAKTSQVVGDLREADELAVFRLGRENVLTLPDVGVGPGTDEEDSPDVNGSNPD
ncbi:MAG: hypothetical protein ABEH56_08550 [Salinirussus sp.]